MAAAQNYITPLPFPEPVTTDPDYAGLPINGPNADTISFDNPRVIESIVQRTIQKLDLNLLQIHVHIYYPCQEEELPDGARCRQIHWLFIPNDATQVFHICFTSIREVPHIPYETRLRADQPRASTLPGLERNYPVTYKAFSDPDTPLPTESLHRSLSAIFEREAQAQRIKALLTPPRQPGLACLSCVAAFVIQRLFSQYSM